MSEPIRIATFNASLNRATEGELIADLSTPDDAQARAIAEIVQKTDADVILINEFDYDAEGAAVNLFRENYLGVGQNGAAAIDYPYVYSAASNTGILSGFDLNGDGVTATEVDRGGAAYAGDSFGFGQFPGQYGFVIFSKHPIDVENVRSFQNFLWKDMPGNLLTEDPTNDKLTDFYSPEEVAALRLSSKNHVDVPVMIDGETVHVLASHPTPPVFDGPEDYNGKRNSDEIRFWADYVEGTDYIYDDAGAVGGLATGARFVILGDQNADPFDGDSFPGAIDQLLDNPLIQGSATDPAITPDGPGGVEQAEVQGGANEAHVGDPAFDTADFGFSPADPTTDVPPGNVRVDYVLPSSEGLVYLDGAVYWPESDDPDFALTSFPTSDHRLVSVDLALTDQDRVTVAPISVGKIVVPLDILLVNDDGFDAEGIAMMRDALLADGHVVRVVAPLEQQSGQGTAIDADRIFQQVTVTEFRPGDFSVDGTPVTTTIAALDFLLADTPPELVISGINEGQNVGQVATSSGTVSAAVTAILRGTPAIAVSAGLDFAEAAEGFPSLGATYVASADLVAALVADLSLRKAQGAPLMPEGTGLNVNMPSGWDGETLAFTTVSGSDGLTFGFTQATPGEDDLTYDVDFVAPFGGEDSEGINFANGAATISVIDGDWSASEAIRAELEARLDALSFEAPSAAARGLGIMLVNDDGFDAPGLVEMADALRTAGHTVRIVAPLVQQSGQGTNIDAAAIGSVITVTEFAPGDVSVDSTPINVTLAGLTALLEDAPDLVISGMNEGENTGVTTISSGTVSAAVAALSQGVPSIAVSAGIDFAEAEEGFPSTEIAYGIGGAFTVDLIADLIATAGAGPLLPEGVGLSVNIPVGEIAGVSVTRLDEVSALGISFGELPGGGSGPTVAPGAPNGDPLSEGSQFLEGFITVTPIDGDYSADAETNAEVVSQLEAGPGLTALLDGTEGDAFLGFVEIPSFTQVDGTTLGGLSGISYDPLTGLYRAVSDDRIGARFYELSIDLSDGRLDAGDVDVLEAVTLNSGGAPLDFLAPDLEGIALGGADTIYVSSERDFLGAPSIYRVGLDGALLSAVAVDPKFLPNAAGTNGVRSNLGFESLTITPDRRTLYTATESALIQDGAPASLALGSAARIIRYDLATGLPVAEYVYEVDPIAAAPDPEDAFADSGLVELIAVDNQGTLLALERSFSTGGEGRGYSGKLYLVRTQGATDVSGHPSIPTGEDDGDLAINVDAVVQKELLLDFDDLGIALDNIEGMTLGPILEDGRQSLIVVSDDNFSGFGPQATQIIALTLDLGSVPTITPLLETPDDLRYANEFDTVEGADPDDPAVWLNPDQAGASVVITAMKEGGMRVFDLDGALIQTIEPEGIRYNNVDILYGVEIGGRAMDLAVASDRANDTLAVFRIGVDGTLSDVTADALPETIFGVDDGEATAYGLVAYRSPLDGKPYVFVTQASGAAIAQLELVDEGGRVGFVKVRELALPVPDGADPADFQSEGITVDRETGVGYLTVEGELGLLSFDAEPTGSDDFDVVAPIDSDFFEPDLEGVAIHYGTDSEGLILVSSQGDSTFAVFDRETEDYLGSFAIRGEGDVDGIEESDGLEIFSGALPGFENGLLVTQDGSNEVQVVFGDPEDGEIQNFNVNFKYAGLDAILKLFGAAANPDFDPRVVPMMPAGVDVRMLARFEGESDPENEDSPVGASEVVAFDDGKLYVTNGNLGRIDVFALESGDPACGEPVDTIDLTGIPGFGGVQSVAVANGLIAAAIRIEDREVALPPLLGGTAVLASRGVVAFFDAETLAPVRTVEVGNLPDQLAFSADGRTLLVANEGEFNGDGELTENPAGSVTVIDICDDFATIEIGFEAFAGFEQAARDAGIRVAPGQSLALDLEPEYIAISPDGATAYVTLQENNTVGVIDLASRTIIDLLPLGIVDHSIPGNAIDPDDEGIIDIRNFENLVGLRMPDAIAAFEIDGVGYFATANEGDGRGDAPEFDEARIEDLEPGAIDASIDLTGLERLAISTVDGDTDGDGDIDVLHAFGARSFTIFGTDGEVVFESGSDLAELIAEVAPERFQDDEGGLDENRSDAKGVEPEAIAIGEIDGEHFAFVGLERDSGIAVFNISAPADAVLVDYIDGFATGDLGPEVLRFVAAADSPTDEALLLAAYEVSGTTVAYELSRGFASSDALALI